MIDKSTFVVMIHSLVYMLQTAHQLAMTEVDLERGDAHLEAAEK